jgi:hypothetical protein
MTFKLEPHMDATVKSMLRQLNSKKIVKPGPGQHVAECYFSKTGFAVWNDDGSCTCNPAKEPNK